MAAVGSYTQNNKIEMAVAIIVTYGTLTLSACLSTNFWMFASSSNF